MSRKRRENIAILCLLIGIAVLFVMLMCYSCSTTPDKNRIESSAKLLIMYTLPKVFDDNQEAKGSVMTKVNNILSMLNSEENITDVVINEALESVFEDMEIRPIDIVAVNEILSILGVNPDQITDSYLIEERREFLKEMLNIMLISL